MHTHTHTPTHMCVRVCTSIISVITRIKGLSYFCLGEDFCMKLEFNPNYNGTMNYTFHGLTCQRWDSQSPHSHQYTDPGLFSGATLEEVANYCRTPDGSGWPWCFTTSPKVRSQVCHIDMKLCGGGITSGTYFVADLARK